MAIDSVRSPYTSLDIFNLVYVNPYTGAIMGDRQWESSFWGVVFKLHYTLLAGKTGEIIVGIAALLLLILSITGIILWSG